MFQRRLRIWPVGLARGIIADTPYEQVEELAKTAEALAITGNPEVARDILAALQADTLGYARPAKKDPQYLFWGEVFEFACADDPASRSQRVELMTRIVTGMAHTEGRNAAYPAYLTDSRVLFEVARAAISSGDMVYCRELLKEYKPENDERAHWDRFLGGAKLDYHKILLDLDGDPLKLITLQCCANMKGRCSVLVLITSLGATFPLPTRCRPSSSCLSCHFGQSDCQRNLAG